MSNLPQAFGYIRVSSKEQVDGHSLAAQQRAIEEYCTRHGYTLRLFIDAGVSAHVEAIRKRPAFKEMLEALATEKPGKLIVHERSRWARNVEVSKQAYRMMKAAGVSFVAILNHIDTDTPEGRLFATIMDAFNEYYSDALGQHMEKATSDRLMKKLHVGQVPFGWRSFKPADAKYSTEPAIVEQDEFDAARRLMIDPLLSRHVSYFDMASNLNAEGWRTRSQKLIARDGVGGTWSADAVRTYLQRRFIAGFVAEDVIGNHTPLVSPNEWERIQAIIETRRHLHPYSQNSNTTRRVYALAGLIRCVHCGTPLEADTVKNRYGYVYKRYSFVCGKRGVSCPSTGTHRTHNVEAIHLEMQAQDICDALAALHSVDVERLLHSPSEAAQRERERNRLEEQRRRIGRRYEQGEITDADHDRKIADVKAALARLRDQDEPALERAKAKLAAIADFPWLQATADRQSATHRSLVEAFFVSPVRDRIVAVAPRAEYRTLMRERVYVRREATGWTIDINGTADYSAPDDWAIKFEALGQGVELARSEGFEPPTPGSEDQCSIH